MNKIRKCIKFVEKYHKYFNTITGEQYLSTTKFISQFYSDFNANKIAYDLVTINYRYQEQYADYSTEDAVIHLKQEWNKRTQVGNTVHNYLELYLKGILSKKNARIHQLTTAFDNLRLRDKYSSFIFIPEYILFSHQYKLAGQADLVLINHEDNSFVILDYKTNQKGIQKTAYDDRRMFFPLSYLPDCNHYHYSLQLNLYAYFLEQELGYKCVDKILLWVNTNSPDTVIIEPIQVGNYYKEIRLMLNEYEQMKKVE